ncbi:MAG: ABC transporter permease subunit [Thermodesulfovibrionia bacterium]|nr:ABC transporter permease subunit [Thermodesulfovibrionia bacterium]
MLAFVAERTGELLIRTREHLFLTGISTGAAVLLGVPLGVYISQKRVIRSFVFGIAGILQTVPSLAMLVFLLTAIGKIGVVPAIIALTLYALLPIIQNTVTGLEGVSSDILEASRGMGMTPWQQMKMVKLPLSLPVIIAGVKTAAVISVGIATLSAFIGAGGLGEFINRGLSLADTRLIMLGAVPSALLALYVSFAIAAIELGLNERKRRRYPIFSGTSGRYIAFIPLLLLFILGLTGQLVQSGKAHPEKLIRIGSKNFTEQLILGEMMAQRIEIVPGMKVERKFNLGGTMICHEALKKGEIDMYPEYTGTGLLAVLKSKKSFKGPEEVYDFVSREYARRFDLKWLAPFGFNNTYAFAIRNEDAEKYGWKTISDVKDSADAVRAGFTAEFSERPDGYPGIKAAYGIEFGKVIDLDPALMYDAVKEKQVDLITAFSTDSRIPGYNLVLLKDDKSFFPPYYAAPVVRIETLNQFPEINDVLAPLAGLLNEQSMQGLNFEVDQKKREVKEVVREFLESNGLIVGVKSDALPR